MSLTIVATQVPTLPDKYTICRALNWKSIFQYQPETHSHAIWTEDGVDFILHLGYDKYRTEDALSTLTRLAVVPVKEGKQLEAVVLQYDRAHVGDPIKRADNLRRYFLGDEPGSTGSIGIASRLACAMITYAITLGLDLVKPNTYVKLYHTDVLPRDLGRILMENPSNPAPPGGAAHARRYIDEWLNPTIELWDCPIFNEDGEPDVKSGEDLVQADPIMGSNTTHDVLLGTRSLAFGEDRAEALASCIERLENWNVSGPDIPKLARAIRELSYHEGSKLTSFESVRIPGGSHQDGVGQYLINFTFSVPEDGWHDVDWRTYYKHLSMLQGSLLGGPNIISISDMIHVKMLIEQFCGNPLIPVGRNIYGT